MWLGWEPLSRGPHKAAMKVSAGLQSSRSLSWKDSLPDLLMGLGADLRPLPTSG